MDWLIHKSKAEDTLLECIESGSRDFDSISFNLVMRAWARGSGWGQYDTNRAPSMSSHLGTLSIQLYHGARQLATWVACCSHVLFAPMMTYLPFSMYVHHDEKKKRQWAALEDLPGFLWWKRLDWKREKMPNRIVTWYHSLWALRNCLRNHSAISFWWKRRNQKRGNLQGWQSLQNESKASLRKKVPPSEEQSQRKSFSSAFDESNAIKMGKCGSMALIAERVESCKPVNSTTIPTDPDKGTCESKRVYGLIRYSCFSVTMEATRTKWSSG